MLQDNFDSRFRRVRKLEACHVGELHERFQDEWWTRGRSVADVQAMLKGPSLTFALVDRESNSLAAFARVLSDGVFKAMLFDVIVSPRFRGAGLGRAIIQHVLEDPSIARVRHVELYCLPELEPFYRRFGFSSDVSGVTLMRRLAPTDTTPR